MLEKIILLYNVKRPYRILLVLSIYMRIYKCDSLMSQIHWTSQEIAADGVGAYIINRWGISNKKNKESLICICEMIHMDKLPLKMRQKSFDVSFKVLYWQINKSGILRDACGDEKRKIWIQGVGETWYNNWL